MTDHAAPPPLPSAAPHELPAAALQHFEWLEAPMWVFDLEHGRIPWANRAGLAFWQAGSLDELSARSFGDMSETTLLRLGALMAAHAEGRCPHEQWTLYPGGVPLTLDLQSRGVQLQDGRMAILFAALHVHTEGDPDALRGVEAMQHTTMLVALHRLTDGAVLMRNPAATRAFGSSYAVPDKGLGLADTLGQLFVQPEQAQAVVEAAQRDRTYTGEVELATREGPRWYRLDARPIWDPVSGERAVQLNALDISALKDAQRALEQARNAAEAANRAKSSFLANMSHEIRTPMNGVLGMTELVLNTALTGRQREFLELAHSSARSLLAIINDILDFSKIEANKLTLEHIVFRVRSLLDETLTPLQAQAAQKNLSLAVDIADDVPDRLIGDPGRIRQVLLNLVGNALKFTSVGEVRVSVTARARADARVALHLSISDTGIGMTEQEVRHVFEPFTQADSSITRRYGGTGLGLAIVQRIVDLMGGHTQVRSAPGYGSTFEVELPCGTVPASEAGDTTTTMELPGGETLRGLQVLLAEDNPINQTLTVAMLDSLGMHGEVARHGAEAVARARERRFDLILMDVQMPVMGGFEATAEIRRIESSDGRRTPIVAMTAYAMEGDRERCLAAGMDGYIAKPVQLQALARVMIDALALRTPG